MEIISILLVISLIFPILPVFLSGVLKFKSKKSSIECGFVSQGTIHKSYSIEFFLVIIIFVVFDLELMLIFPFLFMSSHMVITILIWFFIFISLMIEWWWGNLVWIK